MRSIRAKELRLGQYYDVTDDRQCPFRIDVIEYASDGNAKVGLITNPKLHPLTWYLKDLKPIPFTEEWAIKLGFILIEYSDTMRYYERGEAKALQIIFDNDVITLYLMGVCVFRNSPNFMFVHQVQDYFWVNGLELTAVS